MIPGCDLRISSLARCSTVYHCSYHVTYRSRAVRTTLLNHIV